MHSCMLRMNCIHGLLCRGIRSFFHRNISLSRYYYENHYDVLKLQQNCTQKDIKDAFIKLSKEYHPDKRKTDDSEKFVKLNEAYAVLSHPKTRRDYDLGIVSVDYSVRGSHRNRPSQQYYWENHNRSQYGEYTQKSNVGIERIPMSLLVVVIVLITICGVGFQVYLMKYSSLSRKTREDTGLRNAQLPFQERAQAGGNAAAWEELQKIINTQEDGRKT